MTKKQIIQAIRDCERDLYSNLKMHKETDRILEREEPGDCTTHARAAWAPMWRLLMRIEERG